MRLTARAGTVARVRRTEVRTGSSLSESTTTGMVREEAGGAPRAPREEPAGTAVAVVAAAAGQTGDAPPRARERGLGPGERFVETPPSSSLPARNRESSARARTPAADERAEAGAPGDRTRAGGPDEYTGAGGLDGRAETGVYGGAEGDEETRKGTAEGREAGPRAASSATTSARDCVGLCIDVASLSGSSQPTPCRAGRDNPEHKGRRPNGEPRTGAAG
jgi:hypothetical protein